jgi:hypothetical protein
LRNEYFACELENFACEMKSFRQGLRKLLKSLASEINDFAVSRDFKGLRQVLFRPVSTSAFSARAPDVETSLSSRNFPLAQILFIGKPNRPGRMSARKAKFAAYVRVHGIDRLGEDSQSVIAAVIAAAKQPKGRITRPLDSSQVRLAMTGSGISSNRFGNH